MGERDRTRPTNTIYRSTRALFNPNSHYAHAQDHHRTLLLFLQSYNPSHRPKSPILISILITLGTSNRVSAAARREQSHRRTGCSPRKRETGTHSDQSTHTIQSGATTVKSLLCNSPPDLLRQYPSSKVTIKHNNKEKRSKQKIFRSGVHNFGTNQSISSSRDIP